MSQSEKQPNVSERERISRAFAINLCYNTCLDLFKTGIFNSESVGSPLFQAGVVHMLINLHDLMQKASKDGKRVTHAEHLPVLDDVADLTDLISKCRNVACHILSPLQLVETNTSRFVVVVGRGAAMDINGSQLVAEFMDDTAVFYGEYRLYMKRNVEVALRLIRQVYPDETADDWMMRVQRAHRAQAATQLSSD